MWPLIMMVQILSVDLPQPLELGLHETEITLIGRDDTILQKRLNAIVDHSGENALLRLGQVEADPGTSPETSWEVYVASADSEQCENTPVIAGVFSLYGASAGSEFVFPLEPAILASRPIGLRIIFKPTSGLEMDGKPVPPSASSGLRIGLISLETE